jgi:hypothetical protein
MSRMLPLCAGCGKPLNRGGPRCIQTWGAVRGQPMIGDCDGPACRLSIPRMHGPGRSPLAPALRMIDARGPGRVRLIGGVTIDEACASAEAIRCDDGKPL